MNRIAKDRIQFQLIPLPKGPKESRGAGFLGTAPVATCYCPGTIILDAERAAVWEIPLQPQKI